MEIRQGVCIGSTAAMEDTYFKNTLALITAFNEEGAVGFILNQTFGRNLNELAEFSSSKPFPLHTGGPVDREHLYFIHRQPLLISGGQLIADNLYFGGHFSEAVEAIEADLLTAADVKIFVGYCGWGAGELEAEMAEGSWEIAVLPANGMFHPAY